MHICMYALGDPCVSPGVVDMSGVVAIGAPSENDQGPPRRAPLVCGLNSAYEWMSSNPQETNFKAPLVHLRTDLPSYLATD